MGLERAAQCSIILEIRACAWVYVFASWMCVLHLCVCMCARMFECLCVGACAQCHMHNCMNPCKLCVGLIKAGRLNVCVSARLNVCVCVGHTSVLSPLCLKASSKQHRCTERTTVFVVFSSVHVLLLVDQGLTNNVSKNRSTFFIFTISTLVLALALALVLVPVLVYVY